MIFCTTNMRFCIFYFVWGLMASSVIVSIFTTGIFPIVEDSMILYKTPISGPSFDCVINETTLGSEFQKADNFYTYPIAVPAFIVNFMLLFRIFGSRFINWHMSTFAFFCIFVYPLRFAFLGMQTFEFTKIGGDYYFLLLLDPALYNCNLFSGFVDAVFFMHIRFFLLAVDYFSFHMMILTVPLFYVSDKIDGKMIRYGECSKMDGYSQKVAHLLYSKV
ncbi:unnamed protein product [Caenorhabditis sp. 36 PRJEB53466]|nr:unnamed protein product [Caenorhabditis sp. 36 PRJEB53466]